MREWLETAWYALALFGMLGVLAIPLILIGRQTYIQHRDHPGQHIACVSSHNELRYFAPTYVKVGITMMPIGGGTRSVSVCDKEEWVKD